MNVTMQTYLEMLNDPVIYCYRKRINNSLDQLRTLLPYYANMKKDMASLLEQTVEYINIMHTVLNEDKPACLNKVYVAYRQKTDEIESFRKSLKKSVKRSKAEASGASRCTWNHPYARHGFDMTSSAAAASSSSSLMTSSIDPDSFLRRQHQPYYETVQPGGGSSSLLQHTTAGASHQHHHQNPWQQHKIQNQFSYSSLPSGEGQPSAAAASMFGTAHQVALGSVARQPPSIFFPRGGNFVPKPYESQISQHQHAAAATDYGAEDPGGRCDKYPLRADPWSGLLPSQLHVTSREASYQPTAPPSIQRVANNFVDKLPDSGVIEDLTAVAMNRTILKCVTPQKENAASELYYGNLAAAANLAGLNTAASSAVDGNNPATSWQLPSSTSNLPPLTLNHNFFAFTSQQHLQQQQQQQQQQQNFSAQEQRQTTDENNNVATVDTPSCEAGASTEDKIDSGEE